MERCKSLKKKKNLKNGHVSDFTGVVYPCSPVSRDMTSPTGMHMQAGLVSRSHREQLLHAVPQHLIGGDEHDADDERHGEGADEALPHARLTVLL